MATEFKAFSGQIGDVDLRQLRIFKQVVEAGGFAVAEADLNISRPAISTAVSELETRLGMVLCQRGRAGFVLSDEGKEVYESIVQLFASMENFKAQVNGIHSQLRGDLNIAMTDSMVTMDQMTISDALADLKSRGPEVQINIRMARPAEIERGVIDGKLHVGVIPAHDKELPVLDYIPLYDEISHLYCCERHPLFTKDEITLEDIQQAAYVAYRGPQPMSMKKREAELNICAHASDREGIAFLVLCGAYIGFLPDHYARHWVNTRRVRILRPDLFEAVGGYVAITRSGARPNRILQTFLDNLPRGS